MSTNEIRFSLYEDNEVKSAIQELFGYQSFLDGMKAFLPEQLYQRIIEAKGHVESIFDFQKYIVHPFLKLIEKISISKLTVSGLSDLSSNKKYLFISNHRDIVLDSAFLNMVLFENGLQTSQIAIGDNLMMHRISELLFRINKSFVVKRTGTPRELYQFSLQLSKYIKNTIISNQDSIWIAQREGRTKDGNDRTQLGLLNMLSMSDEGQSMRTHFEALNIVPVAISYEFDPCAWLKTEEYLLKLEDPDYKKPFQKDVEHMITGLKGEKGNVHFHFGKPLKEELQIFDSISGTKKQLENLAAIIDKHIHLNYKLHPINYTAFDLLHENRSFPDRYTSEEFEKYRRYFDQLLKPLSPEKYPAGRKYLLEMYANPVVNTHSSS